uniref:Integrase catalytic domain-containing protein n=1 Tax=Fagus sylvatica TaxID=28930 RepID=A0A2N9HYG2_FAGSY
MVSEQVTCSFFLNPKFLEFLFSISASGAAKPSPVAIGPPIFFHQALPVTPLFSLFSCCQRFAVVLGALTPLGFASGSWIFLEPSGSSRYRIFSESFWFLLGSSMIFTQTTISSDLSVFSALVEASQLTSISVTLSDRGIKQCTHCGCTNHYVDGDNSNYLPVDQVLISKIEYDSLLQRANVSSSSLITSGNTCLHSSSSPSWVIDSGASDHMTGNSSLLSHTSSPCSPSFVTIANGTKTPIQGKGTVTISDFTLSDDLKMKRMIGGGFVKDELYYFQPSSTSVPSALHSTNSPYQCAFQQFLKSRGIIHQTPYVRTPQQNGNAERKNGPILVIARALMLQMNVPKLFRADAVLFAAYLLNRMSSRILKGKSPFEIPNRDKLDPRAHKCIFLGYSHTQKGYRCYNPSLRKHFVSADVTFFEDIPYYSPKGRQLQESMLSTPVIHTHVPIVPPTSPIPIVPPIPRISQVYVSRRNQDVPLIPPPPPVEFSLPLPPSASTSEDSPPPQSTLDLDLPIAIRKGKRTCTEHPISNRVSFDHLSPSFKAFSLSLSSLVVPKSYREALSHPGWRKAMEEEMHALELNHIWDLIPKPAGTSIVGCRWVFTVKQNPDGTVDRLKARLVAKGFTQTYGLDYTETFSPVAKLNSIRIIISLAANLDWPLHQLDVKNAFLHGDLTKTVYMTQPPGKAVVSHGMTHNQTDHSVFFKKTRTGIVILVVYVDNIVIIGSDKEGIQILINHLSSSFLTKDLDKLHYFLGIEVILAPNLTPMEPNLKLMPDEGDFVDDPNTYHRLIVIRILKYLKNAPGRGLFYRSSDHLRIEGYTDADWAGSPSDRKSTTGYCTFIGGNHSILLVIQSFKKEPSISKLIVTLFILKMESKDIIMHHSVPSGSQLADKMGTGVFCN